MNPNISPDPDSELAGFTYCGCNRYTEFRREVNSNRKRGRRPQRTSTPIDFTQDRSEWNVTSNSCSHSVSEFFYQSWKNELNFDKCEQYECRNEPLVVGNFIQNFNYYIVNHQNYHPSWYPSQVVLVNAYNPYFTPYSGSIIYCPAIGYRGDGTYGVLPGFWYCYYG